MCGIAGEIRFDGQPASEEAVREMNRRQAARGPDAEGIHRHGNVVLGHRRLKIIDLSDRGAQPMVDTELGLAIVFNGCIYNYRELREELRGLGHSFRSTSDTEVLLKAYAAWGKNCVKHLNGMFAFVILEQETGRLFMARDRLGIKPLYFTDSGDVMRFASSLPALLAVAEQPAEINPVGLHHYMSFHSVVPAPHTIVAGYRKLPPATIMVVRPDGGRHVERYWEPHYNGIEHPPFEEMRDQVLAALDRAVQRRMVADVPVGVLLSGGVDSSLVVALLARNGASGLNTFTVGFEAAGNEEGNEFRYSDLIANTFGTVHHRIEVGSERLVETLPACFRAMNEPMVSHDAIGFFLLSQMVSQHVTVVQSGQGADEIFGGYFWYPPLMESKQPAADYARGFFDRDHDEMGQALDSRWYGSDYSRDFVERHFAVADAQRSVDKALHLDSTVMLVDDPVKRVDNMTMAWGLEARVPFLDHEVVELAASIPPEMKVVPEGKYILKEAARQVLPAEVIDRPKGYFPVPALKYLNGHSLDFVKDAINSQAARERGLFRRPYIDTLLDAPTEHLTPLRGSKLWQVAALEVWLQTHAA
ncbi:MAG: N-acetylglutaminylglutamine amidotransferase [Gammaproteobacteria bacterium]|nr:N-acetylglutaminylglutamine amidotransferase [Gammaproteobacteria bacterium]